MSGTCCSVRSTGMLTSYMLLLLNIGRRGMLDCLLASQMLLLGGPIPRQGDVVLGSVLLGGIVPIVNSLLNSGTLDRGRRVGDMVLV